jgi:hypothetical protein
MPWHAMLRKEGLIKCSTSNEIGSPLFPFRCNNELLFCLCKTCAIEQNVTSDCTHETIAERAVIGTWVIDEVRLVIQKFYTVTDFWGLRIWSEALQPSGGLFVHFIKMFLKLKAEASGYPSWFRTPTDEDRTFRISLKTRESSCIKTRYS